MAVTNVIPELWAREMVEVLKNKLVAAGICNTTIASALNMEGDKFHIPVAGTTSTAAYVEGTTTISYTSPTDTVKTLTIDQDQYAALNISDEEVKQANQDYQREYARDIAFNLAEDIDQQVMGLYTAAGLDSYETGTTPWQLGATGADFPKLIASLHRQLDAAKAILSQPIGSIVASDTLFNIAETCGVEVTEISSSGSAGGELEGIACSVLPLTARVEGDIPNLINFIIKLNGDFTTGAVKSVDISVSENTTEERSSANIQLLVYTYQGD